MTDTVYTSAAAFLDQGTTNSYDIDTNDYTFIYAAKLRTGGAGGSQRTIAEVNQNGDHHFSLIYNASDELTLFATGGGYLFTVASITDIWLHIALVRASGVTTCYVIAEGFNPLSPSYLINQEVALQDGAATTNHHYIWIFGGASLDSDGRIQIGHVQVWTTALTESQVLAEFGSRAAVVTANLHSSLDCDSTTNIGVDVGGGGKDYTTSGSFQQDTDEPSDWTGGAAPAAPTPQTGLAFTGGMGGGF